MTSGQIHIKRIYEPASDADGARVLVDRIWPRGIKREEASLTAWLKDLAPTKELRQWFGHDPSRFAEFEVRYNLELDHLVDDVGRLRALIAKGKTTLVYAAKDETHNNAAVLARYLQRQTGPDPADDQADNSKS